jgi:Tol biopolymer transport system component
MFHFLVLATALQQPVIVPPDSGEVHLRNIRQLTSGGQNAEAYFSRSGTQLIFQRTPGDTGCDQQYTMNSDGTGLRRVSSGLGRTTCGYYYARDARILYASTEHLGPACPPRPDYSRGYVWALYDYDIYVADSSGAHATPHRQSRHDAEGTLSPDGQTIVLRRCATRSGHLHDAHGWDAPKRLT